MKSLAPLCALLILSPVASPAFEARDLQAQIDKAAQAGQGLGGTAQVVKDNRISGSALKDIHLQEEGALAP